MEKQDERHERVRFRRDEITALETLPSAHSTENVQRGRRSGRVWLRAVAWTGFGIVVLLSVVVGTLYLAGSAGIGGDRLKREASAALSALAGIPIDVTAGPARLSLSSSSLVSLEIPDVGLSASSNGREFARAGALRFGVSLWPLLHGDLHVTEVSLADATIAPPTLSVGGDGDWSAPLRNARGLLDPDLVVEQAFAAVDRAFEGLRGRYGTRISLENVVLTLGPDADARSVEIASADIWSEDNGALQVVANIEADGVAMEIAGNAEQGSRARGMRFSLSADISLDEPVADTAQPPPVLSGGGNVALSGARLPGGGERLRFTARGKDLLISVPEMQPLVGDIEIGAVLKIGTGKVEFERVRLATSRSALLFNGAIGPIPEGEGEADPAYRWEFVSNGSRVAGVDVSEPALPFVARLAGTYAARERLLTASEIGVRTAQGEVVGQATVEFEPGLAPAIALALDIPRMPVAHAKQLWPSEVAPGARSWVLANVFGGTVKDSRVRFRVPAGRLGNGQMLDAGEINGRFEVADTRFDITGDLPAVRDAHGSVDFRGSDVDVLLSSGTVFMPTGRTLSAENGSFLIRDVESKPTIGFMDIDVKGEAPAVVEFASYRPINALRHLQLKPEDFSGQAAGNVRADIPLREDFPIEHLNWEVDLTYEGLAIAQPVEGQQITQARGTIKVDPAKAVIEASAQLNGMAAEIRLTEPLGEEGSARNRDVTLVLDDAARAKIAPGLNQMLSGPVKVSVDLVEGGVQRLEADLGNAELSLPWVGWTKGKGIPATATFTLSQDGAEIAISDFRLTGNSFSLDGDMRLSGGELIEARFGNVTLNRGDQIAFSLEKQGRGYAIKLDGDVFDARSIVKLYLAETEKAEKAVESVPITLDATVGRMSGFGDEVLSDVRVKLRGKGTDVGSLEISAASASGARVAIVNTTGGGGRSVEIDSGDAGALLRFLNIYEHMQGGVIRLALAATPGGPLRGQVEARDFWIVNEPKLRSLISTPLPQSDGRSLAQTVRREIDDQKARFERGFALIEKGSGYLGIDRGVLRGPVIGATFQGTFYDQQDKMNMTGTFMPAYGINRIFGEIPLIGQILGNGRDRGLIGITFRLAGDAKSPQLQVNPLSAVAPGIFRSIFEYN